MVKKWILLIAIIALSFFTILFMANIFKVSTISEPIYSKDNIEVYYNNTDSISVVNNNDDNIDIIIGDSYHSVAATQGRKVAIGLNSSYGKIKVNINNKDTITINYTEPDDDYYYD